MTTEGQPEKPEQEKSPDQVSHAKRATMIRRLVMLLVFGVAITLGFFVELPVWDSIAKERVEDVNEEEEQAIRDAMAADHQLTVLNTMVDGNPDSEKLKRILEQLKQEKYHDQVEPVDLHVDRHKNIAEEHEIDLEEFAGRLDFYAGGQKLGTLLGETDAEVVEKTIDRYLAGLIKRYGPNWLPKVDGMTRAGTQATAPRPAPAQPTGVPGMQRTGGTGVPGMSRAKSGESNLKVEPADQPGG
ncbi:MAG: hypothetical protein AAGB14_06190 [Verrucomicrobiota bacterium]